MQSDPRGTPDMRAPLIIGGVIIFGTPIFVILTGFLGVGNAIIAIFALLAIVAFAIVRRYFERRRVNRPSASQPYRSTGTTRDWPQKYNKHGRRSYNAAANRPRKPELTSPQRGILKVLRFALKPLRFVWYILNNRPEGDIKKDELLHRQTRNTPLW
jgi:predicted lipid-binding transport protein (Tim44 family)